MISGHHFKRIRRRRPVRAADGQPKDGTIRELVDRYVIERFARISGLGAITVPLTLPGSEDLDDWPPNPCHPVCAAYADSDYCQESWQLHLIELRDRPEPHWHKCDYDRLCAYVPVVYHDRCVAGVKLACPASMGEEEFERHVELLDALIKDLVSCEADLLARLLRNRPVASDPEPSAPNIDQKPLEQRPSHPQVLRALQYIDEHLFDTNLTVAWIARELDIHPYYLSHLFAGQVGQRMGRFIAARRVDRAKTLLAATDWQIKRIALDTGYANPNWFSHVFGVHTGLTPLGYRKRARAQSLALQTD